MREIYFITYFRLLTYLSQHSLTLALDRWTSGVINLFNLFVFLLHHQKAKNFHGVVLGYLDSADKQNILNSFRLSLSMLVYYKGDKENIHEFKIGE
ncbi:hypothetical protein RIR_jg15835.t1 [Rhizophagus irregularis DAOM 181602=DAOM 197198]|nr:hypothetical protein RIR_jg15835.t1 [Rhizophagus irregularis DAOM 181602=DAOM 197198]